MSHDVQQIKLVDNFFRTDPSLQKLPQLMKTQLKVLILKSLMELPRLPRFRLQHQIFLNKRFNLFPSCYPRDILPNVDQRPIKLDLILQQLRENKLNLWIKLPNFQTLEVLLFELPHNIRIVRNHGLQKPR